MSTYRFACTLVLGSLFGMTLFASGCSMNGEDVQSGGQELTGTASFAASLARDPSFAGNSVKVCGKRRKPADAKYPCQDGWGKEPLCECLTFDGYPADGDSTAPKALKDLCPSKDLAPNTYDTSEVPWDFTLTVFNDAKCGYAGGTAMTTGEDKYDKFNFVCYEQDDLKKREHPNAAHGEILKPGKNVNDIVCITRNASKEFNFDVCVDESAYGDGSKLNCGCEFNPYSYKCECKDQPGVTDPDPSTPPYGFKFDNYCNLVSSTPVPR